ncbi:MAG: DUF3291 domain-containing protein [Pseudomonadota bacterium]
MRDEDQTTHIAHVNWATLVADAQSPRVASFFAAVDRVNALAERSAGFVWRDGSERSHAVAIGWPLFVQNPRLIASFSVWQTPQALADYVFKTVHGAFLRRAAEWFEPGSGGHALWPVRAGHIPDMAEAQDRVTRLERTGPCNEVFTLDTLCLGRPDARDGETSPRPAPV